MIYNQLTKSNKSLKVQPNTMPNKSMKPPTRMRCLCSLTRNIVTT